MYCCIHVTQLKGSESSEGMYDVIVVGAGIEGSSTAYYLAKSGKRTLLLEQFPLPHSRGSSHGQSRITRKVYGSKDFYTEMMKESYELTDVLQRECGEQLFVNCGCLVFGPQGDPYITGAEQSLARYGVSYEKFDVNEQRRRYPMMSLPDNYELVLDKSGGLLRADKMLRAYHQQFVRYGGILNDSEPMVDIDRGDVVTVRTTKATYKARSVVLALGAWAAKFLPLIGVSVPLQPLRTTVCYWKDTQGDYDIKKFPTFFSEIPAWKQHIYGLPVYEYPGLVKICLHHGPPTDPDHRDAVDDHWVLDTIKEIVATHFPTLEKEPHIVEKCMYTNTPDTDFILDVHPAANNVVIAAGFSGHGFKLSPVVGKVLAQLATGQKPSYDLSPFRMDRFPTTVISPWLKLDKSKL